jgi:hypothetical protein
MKRVVLILLAILTASSLLLAQGEKIDFAAIGRIKEIGLACSQTRFDDEATMNGFNTVADLPGACSATIWSNKRPSSRSLPTTPPPCGISGCRAKRCRRQSGAGNRLNEAGDDRQRDPRKESIDIIPPWPENGRS